MKKNSPLAIVSFVAGCLALLCAWSGPGAPLLAAIPLGILAILMGAVALSRLRPPRQGRGFALAGLVMGALSSISALLVLISLFLQQFSPGGGPRRGWDPERHAQEMEARNRMADGPAAEFSSNLGIVVLDTDGQSISKNRSTLVRARFFDAGKGRASLNAQPAYDGLATINLRGYSTLHLPKRSYTLHTVDKNTNQIKVPLLGLPAEEDWVLYAPYEDKTLMRDALAYELSRRMGRYAPRTRFVELFVRDSDRPISMRDYVGVYVLVEKIKRGQNRVNIAKLDPEHTSEPEVAGGYILKRDHSDRSDQTFNTRQGGPYSYVYPKAARITPAQKRWIRKYLNDFEAALHGEDFSDPKTGYAAFLDVDAFIDAHWLIEMSKNVDGFRYSAFLTKDRGGKLQAGPPWDWNRAFGNANYYGGGQTRGWYSTHLRPNEISWSHRLRQDPAFNRRCEARWRELRQDVFDPKKIGRLIDAWAAQLREAQDRNFRRWPVLGRQITCNHYVGDSFEEEVSWLKKWIERRIAWIDNQVGARD